MADQDFQESDIIFQEHVGEDINNDQSHRRNPFSDNKKKLKRKKNKEKENSLPVSIPANNASAPARDSNSWFHYVDSRELDDGDFTPPHVILGRRMNGKMAFSVCTGNGRTLKGRDLSQVRNSILRMTGFLES